MTKYGIWKKYISGGVPKEMATLGEFDTIEEAAEQLFKFILSDPEFNYLQTLAELMKEKETKEEAQLLKKELYQGNLNEKDVLVDFNDDKGYFFVKFTRGEHSIHQVGNFNNSTYYISEVGNFEYYLKNKQLRKHWFDYTNEQNEQEENEQEKTDNDTKENKEQEQTKNDYSHLLKPYSINQLINDLRTKQ